MDRPTENVDMDDPFNKVFYELMTMEFQSRVASGEKPKEDFIRAVSQFLTANIIGAYENIQHMHKQWQDQFGHSKDN